ncbi:hypothetical protein BDQ17DRAFT_1371091, partial [Cyathus striatus]
MPPRALDAVSLILKALYLLNLVLSSLSKVFLYSIRLPHTPLLHAGKRAERFLRLRIRNHINRSTTASPNTPLAMSPAIAAIGVEDSEVQWRTGSCLSTIFSVRLNCPIIY